MENKIGGLRLFRSSLYNAASRSLQEKHPQYVGSLIKKLEETSDISEALDAVKAIPTETGFAKWRPLLTAEFDTELTIDQVRRTLYLLKLVPTHDIPVSEGAWVYYNLQAWIFWMDALIERAKKLIKQSIRVLVRPNNPQWKDIESDLLKSINVLSEKIGEVRDPLAHGGGVAETPAKERLWEGLVLILAGIHSDKHSFDKLFDSLFEPMANYHTSWYERSFKTSVIVLAAIGKEMEKLSKQIDWDNI